MLVRIGIAFAVSAGLAASAMAQLQPTFNDLPVHNFGTAQSPIWLTLDLYINPAAVTPCPVILRVHGGAWQSGSNFPISGIYQQLLQRGFAIASLQYRLTSQAAQWGGAPVTFPAQIHDLRGAIRFLRANAATYHLDSSRFGASGESAGAHLVALLGTSGGLTTYSHPNGQTVDLEGTVGGNPGFSSTLQAVADYFGPTDLLRMNLDVTTPPGSTTDHDAPSSPESKLLGWTGVGQGIGDIRANEFNPTPPYPALVALAYAVNPVTHVSSDDPPFIIAHGGMDTTVPQGQSQRLATALMNAGVAQSLLINPTAGHSAQGAATDTAVVDFFIARLMPAGPGSNGDIDADGDIDGADATALAAVLVGTPLNPAHVARSDLNGDHLLTGLDVAMFAAAVIP